MTDRIEEHEPVDPVRERMAQYKLDHPEVDWDTHSVYAVVDDGTGELERIGYARRDKIISYVNTPEVGR